ncbi:MAG: adenylyltransferase/cytidyltransferase family protein, partial [Chthoniobacterales bacterium]
MQESRIIPFTEIEKISRSFANRKVVLTNGCFDILHAGHVRYLEQTKLLGDILLVGLNADASVRTLKGDGRPVNSESDRAEVLSSLRCVDYVTIFPQVRATELIRALRPAVYAKGGDYTPESLDAEEGQALREVGAEIHILPLVPGKSTTNILNRAKSNGC